MPAPASADELLELLRKSGLVDVDRLQAHIASQRMPADPSECVDALIAAGLLTRFQAKLLLQGKHKGFLVGDFKVLRPLGKGGMGLVYLAERLSQPQRVAIKLIPNTHLGNEAIRERFCREARAVAVMDHPNIVQIHEVHTEDECPYVVLEYVDGISLRDLVMREGRIPIRRAVNYIVQAASGLDHAHDRGVVHRDIKPDNLLLRRDGLIKILDLGLARFVEDRDDNLTERLCGNVVLGSPDYIAPEQIRRQLDTRSDIYSLGATLYTLLVGESPVAGLSKVEKVIAHVNRPVKPPHLRNPAIPQELSACVMRMMAKNPDHRFSTLADVIVALGPWVAEEEGVPVVEPITPPPAEQPPELRRIAPIAVAFLFVLGLLAVYFFTHVLRAE